MNVDHGDGHETLIHVAPYEHHVYVGDAAHGMFRMTSEQAREIARRLLVAADEAEGKTPAHIYQVDNR